MRVSNRSIDPCVESESGFKGDRDWPRKDEKGTKDMAKTDALAVKQCLSQDPGGLGSSMLCYVHAMCVCYLQCGSGENSLLPIQIAKEVPAEIRRRDVETKFLVNRIQLVQILLLQLEIPGQITPYPRGRLALRQNAVSEGYPPCQGNLRAILAVFLANLDNGPVVDQLPHALTGAVDFILIAEGGVVCDVDAFALVELGK